MIGKDGTKQALLLGTLTALAGLTTVMAGCAPPEPSLLDGEVAGAEASIVGGTIERGRPEVVFVYNLAGAGCTGALIAPRVVLTAKHCVQAVSGGALQPRVEDPSRVRVYVGTSPSSFTAEYRASELLAAPGSWDLEDASDVGIIVLSSNAREAPMAVSFDNPIALTGQTFTAVGYGQTPSGSSGTKYTTTGTVRRVISNVLLEVASPTICQGDSGGPLIASDGRIWGVVSFGDNRSCGSAIGYYNGLAHLRSFIEAALGTGSSCVPSGAESCDGEDNDCDELVDEGCMPLGSPCTGSNECIGGLCAETVAGRVCTTECDPMRPSLGCSPGSYCALFPGSCDGYCVSGAPGSVGYNEACTSNTECASLFCADPGDGRRRCLDPCRGDAGGCLAGEVCAAPPGACNACVPETLVVGGRALGEGCDTDGECNSGLCYERDGVRECARACASDADCGERFECRATEDAGSVCIRDQRQGTGGGCDGNLDCDEGLCAEQGDRAWCTRVCASEADCPTGFSCVDAGGANVCAPSGALLGEDCAAGCLTGLCASVPQRGEVCTSECNADQPCPVGFECTRLGDTAICIEASAPVRGAGRGSCAVSAPHPSRGGGLFLGLLGLALAAWVVRRRSR